MFRSWYAQEKLRPKHWDNNTLTLACLPGNLGRQRPSRYVCCVYLSWQENYRVAYETISSWCENSTLETNTRRPKAEIACPATTIPIPIPIRLSTLISNPNYKLRTDQLWSEVTSPELLTASVWVKSLTFVSKFHWAATLAVHSWDPFWSVSTRRLRNFSNSCW